ncbi:MAG: hypothetical protein JSR91_03855 [Proteobacteria bacterium]|nr:hypothetical protein [Pseudomonadota bacterium]
MYIGTPNNLENRISEHRNGMAASPRRSIKRRAWSTWKNMTILATPL